VNTIVLPCDVHWDVIGITKSDSPTLPAVLHDEGGATFLHRRERRKAARAILANTGSMSSGADNSAGHNEIPNASAAP
jgi:hypothetical protein